MGFIYCFPPSQVALRDSKTSPRPASARLPSRDGSPSLALLSFIFIFYILFYLLSKTMGCFSGRLMTSAGDQKLFCEVCSVFGYSFDEFVGEKVVSPSYSSTILAPPPVEVCLNSKFSKEGKAEWWDSIRYTHSACISSLPVCSVMSDSLQTHGL